MQSGSFSLTQQEEEQYDKKISFVMEDNVRFIGGQYSPREDTILRAGKDCI